jgi:hypothetical protein
VTENEHALQCGSHEAADAGQSSFNKSVCDPLRRFLEHGESCQELRNNFPGTSINPE